MVSGRSEFNFFLSVLLLIILVSSTSAFQIGTGINDKDAPYNLPLISEPSEVVECIDGEDNDFDFNGNKDANDLLCFHPLDNTEKCILEAGGQIGKYESTLVLYDYQCDKFTVSGELPITKGAKSFFNIYGGRGYVYTLDGGKYLAIKKWPSTDLLIFDGDKNLQAIITDETLEENRNANNEGADLYIPYEVSNPTFMTRINEEVLETEADTSKNLPYHIEFLQTKFGWERKSPVNVYVRFEDFDIGEIDERYNQANEQFKSDVVKELKNLFKDYPTINIIKTNDQNPSDASTVLTYTNLEFYDRLGDLNPQYVEGNPNKINEVDPWNNRLKTDMAYVFGGTFAQFKGKYRYNELVNYFAQVGAHEVGHSFGLYDVDDTENIMDYCTDKVTC